MRTCRHCNRKVPHSHYCYSASRTVIYDDSDDFLVGVAIGMALSSDSSYSSNDFSGGGGESGGGGASSSYDSSSDSGSSYDSGSSSDSGSGSCGSD